MKLPRLVSPRALAASGVLGMNRRNYSYIMRYNRRADYPDVDDNCAPRSWRCAPV